MPKVLNEGLLLWVNSLYHDLDFLIRFAASLHLHLAKFVSLLGLLGVQDLCLLPRILF